MSDRERIINDFEHAVNKARGDYYDYVDLTVEDADKILKLLEEQEAEIKRLEHELAVTQDNLNYYVNGKD